MGLCQSAAPGTHFLWQRPSARSVPVLVEVPHAGLAIPDAVRQEIIANPTQVARDSDIYVDKLCEGVPSRGAELLIAQTSRFVVDLNRAADDIDGRAVPDHPAPRGTQPRGVVWRMATDGKALLSRPLDYGRLEARLDRFYRPYHAAIQHSLTDLRERFGHALLLAAHSMPSGKGRGLRRADVVPGTRGRTTSAARFIDALDAHFRAAGLSVRHDEPYRGGYSTSHYGRPKEGWHAIQIELNRALYVDEGSGRPKDGAFNALRDVMTTLVDAVADL
ncbi:MAG: N-formylglutamate amidohydrolase [Myxococcota bacterium]